jgi:hypothetical protein
MSPRTNGKLLAPPLAVLALTAGVYHGDRVTINFPDGWSAPDTVADGIVASRQGDSDATAISISM